jgi:hypothetical protein
MFGFQQKALGVTWNNSRSNMYEAWYIQKPSNFLKDKCIWMVQTNIPWFKHQMPKFHPFFGKVLQKKYIYISEQSILQKHYMPIYYEEILENIKGDIIDAFIWVPVVTSLQISMQAS